MLSGIPLRSSQFISPFSGIHLNKQTIPILKWKVNLPLLVLVVNEMVASECKGDGDTGEKAQTNFLSASHCKQMFSCLQRSFYFISSLNRFVPCWEEITEIGKNFMVSEKNSAQSWGGSDNNGLTCEKCVNYWKRRWFMWCWSNPVDQNRKAY